MIILQGIIRGTGLKQTAQKGMIYSHLSLSDSKANTVQSKNISELHKFKLLYRA